MPSRTTHLIFADEAFLVLFSGESTPTASLDTRSKVQTSNEAAAEL